MEMHQGLLRGWVLGYDTEGSERPSAWEGLSLLPNPSTATPALEADCSVVIPFMCQMIAYISLEKKFSYISSTAHLLWCAGCMMA